MSLKGSPRGGPGAEVSLPEACCGELFQPAGLLRHKACSLLILDKGKPVARPGRKAKDRRIDSGGSLATERMIRIASASDEGEVCFN